MKTITCVFQDKLRYFGAERHKFEIEIQKTAVKIQAAVLNLLCRFC